MTRLLVLIPLLAFFKIATVSADGAGHDWMYDHLSRNSKLDPTVWSQHYPQCGGQRQSPIDVVDSAVKVDLGLKRLQFVNYDQALTGLVMVNDGHTIKVTMPKTANLSLVTPSLPASYRLTQFHFHWPSEHTINGYKFPLELHLVHAHSKLQDNETTTNTAGLVVVAVLFDYRQGSSIGNAMKTIIANTASTGSEGQNVTLNGIKLKDLLPSDISSYVRYSGSLTTPPCAEVVEFIIMTHTQPIAKSDVAKFAALRHEILNANNEETETPITHNDRPMQKLNGRTLRLYGDMGDLPSLV